MADRMSLVALPRRYFGSQLIKLGIAMVAMTAIIPITVNISISVNPELLRMLTISLPGLNI